MGRLIISRKTKRQRHTPTTKKKNHKIQKRRCSPNFYGDISTFSFSSSFPLGPDLRPFLPVQISSSRQNFRQSFYDRIFIRERKKKAKIIRNLILKIKFGLIKLLIRTFFPVYLCIVQVRARVVRSHGRCPGQELGVRNLNKLTGIANKN